MACEAADNLTKQPREDRLYDMDFSNLLGTGEVLTSVSLVEADPATGISLGTPTHDSMTKAQVRISSGTEGTLYKISMVVVTSFANTLEGDGYLWVVDL